MLAFVQRLTWRIFFVRLSLRRQFLLPFFTCRTSPLPAWTGFQTDTPSMIRIVARRTRHPIIVFKRPGFFCSLADNTLHLGPADSALDVPSGRAYCLPGDLSQAKSLIFLFPVRSLGFAVHA